MSDNLKQDNCTFLNLDPSKLRRVQNLKDKLGIGNLLAKVCAKRCENANEDDLYDAANNLLKCDISSDWDNPYNITNLENVCNVIEHHVKQGSHIVVFGDYDLDGMSASTVMLRGISMAAKHSSKSPVLHYFLPSRFKEGYGITYASMKRLLDTYKDIDLLITVDCGIACAEQIKHLRETGIDVVVTDHHEYSGKIDDEFVVNPKYFNDDRSVNLAGVGVALKVVQVILARFGQPAAWQELTEFATLGTISDVMTLDKQNKALVTAGLERINSKERNCINAMFESVGNKSFPILSTDLSFSVIPMLNSAGRLDHAEEGVELLMQEDQAAAFECASKLSKYNTERKALTESLTEIASFQAESIIQNNPNSRVLVVSGQDWHEGVIGIVAAKIAGDYELPAIVFSIKDGVAKGSGRAFGNVNLYEAISKHSDMMDAFGGHSGACGMTLSADKLPEFAEALQNALADVPKSQFKTDFDVDAIITLDELYIPDIEELNKLQPCGQGNNYPLFEVDGVFIKSAKAVGSDKNHLSCVFSDGVNQLSGIMFFCNNVSDYVGCESAVKVIFEANVDEWKGSKKVKAIVKDIQLLTDKSSIADKENYEHLFEKHKNVSSDDVFEHSSPKEQKFGSSPAETLNCDYSNTDIKEVQDDIVKAMIGEDGKLHPSQQEALDMLGEGKSGLAVLPTGRGKSLIFQVFAASIALKYKKVSLFVYPLRALIADQAFHLSKSLGQFGLKCCVLSGETSQEERQQVYNQLKNHEVDIVLTTPEFLDFHVDEIAENASIGFVVIDESHHIGEVKVGQRTAYGNMPKILEKLGDPQVLALSATVSEDVYSDIKKYLPIENLITDNYERANLFIDDKRNIADKDNYLASIVASGQKIVIYVNSREQTLSLARMLKAKAPHVAMKIGFYNAGMSKSQRKEIETYFRDNKLSCLIATSAFGEGVNIPDIRHVALYHLPFSEVQFNQMSGRAGRDENPAVVHMLYSAQDASINTGILEIANPTREILGKIYLWVRDKVSSSEEAKNVTIVQEDLQSLFESGDIPAAASTFMCGLCIFEELGLIQLKKTYTDGKTQCIIELLDNNQKVNLEDSSRFCEGQNEIFDFEQYRDKAMLTSVEDLTKMLRHPIVPVINN